MKLTSKLFHLSPDSHSSSLQQLHNKVNKVVEILNFNTNIPQNCHCNCSQSCSQNCSQNCSIFSPSISHQSPVSHSFSLQQLHNKVNKVVEILNLNTKLSMMLLSKLSSNLTLKLALKLTLKLFSKLSMKLTAKLFQKLSRKWSSKLSTKMFLNLSSKFRTGSGFFIDHHLWRAGILMLSRL